MCVCRFDCGCNYLPIEMNCRGRFSHKVDYIAEREQCSSQAMCTNGTSTHRLLKTQPILHSIYYVSDERKLRRMYA